MRVIVDANLLVSYLLSSKNPTRTVQQLVEAAITGDYTLLLPLRLLSEIEEVLATKPYVRERVAASDAEAFIALLKHVGDELPEADVGVPMVTRDPDDDYLLAAAIAGDADYLVTGDKDLLALRDHLDRPRIMTAADFLQELAEGD